MLGLLYRFLFKITVTDRGSKVDTFATPIVSTGLSYTESSYRSTVFGMRQGYNGVTHGQYNRWITTATSLQLSTTGNNVH